jgi:hypothetical protein
LPSRDGSLSLRELGERKGEPHSQIGNAKNKDQKNLSNSEFLVKQGKYTLRLGPLGSVWTARSAYQGDEGETGA